MHSTEFVESYLDAWNHHDPMGVANHLGANGIYCDIPENVQRSQQELITHLQEFFTTYRHHYELIGDILTNGDTIAYQYRMVPAEGSRRKETYRGADFITLHHDEAVTIIDYYDVPGIGRPSGVARMTSRKMRDRKYAKSGLGEDTMSKYQARLEHIMRAEQVFLQPDLTLPKLAAAVDCSVNHLSQVINSGLGMSFFDYLNSYRIAYAKDLLATTDGRNRAILNIAFAVGFNSNSAFYAAFKKSVGQTPAQFRKARLERSH